jgi:hypothetical protein
MWMRSCAVCRTLSYANSDCAIHCVANAGELGKAAGIQEAGTNKWPEFGSSDVDAAQHFGGALVE